MKRSCFSEEQIIGILKEHEAGVSVADLCRKHGVSDASIYKWKAKFGGLEVSEAKRLRTPEDENTRLKRLWPTPCWTMRRCRTSWERSGDARGQAESCRASHGYPRDEQTAGV
jgi:putative transposase